MSDMNTNENAATLDGQDMTATLDGQDTATQDAPMNGKARREARRLTNSTTKPAEPSVPQLPEVKAVSPAAFLKLDKKAKAAYIASLKNVARLQDEIDRANRPARRGDGGGIGQIARLFIADPATCAHPDKRIALVRKHKVMSSKLMNGSDAHEPVSNGLINAVNNDLVRYLPILIEAGFGLAEMKNWVKINNSSPRK